MSFPEPTATAAFLLVVGLLLVTSALFSRASARFGVPVFLLFLCIGMLAGSEGIGGIAFEDYRFAFRLGTLSLVLILFDGGLNTPLPSVRRVLPAASALATAGVLATALLVAAAARLLGFPWMLALLLGAVVSSTDAAAVFSVLRASGIQLKRRVGATLEVESGINDPMAVILTAALVDASLGRGAPLGWLLAGVPLQLAIGGAVGWAIGQGGRWLLGRVRLPAGGLYAVLTLSFALLAFGAATLVRGSGFLAVYLAGLALGNGSFPYRSGLLRFHDAAAWLSHVTMFVILGLLVFPSRLMPVAGTGVVLALLLVFVARPLVVLLCLLPFRYPWRESLYVGWVGLRGAVPIILATMPVLAGVPAAEPLFHLVFFVVVVTALVPGGTVGWASRRLGLTSDEPAAPPAVLEISSLQPLDAEILAFAIAPAAAACGATIAQLPFPGGSHVMLVVRGESMLAPRGDTRIEPGDHVYVFCNSEDVPFMRLLFGRPEQS
ncbi:MAG TPA: potassium/proton antiporter [Thermoanaerobaculia bacterium]|nr:potassium/proton antiporter [Thermoanaerobaculia bacterium]